MRGGLERWKRGVESHGVRSAMAYALEGSCDASMRLSSGVEALATYSESAERTVTRFTVTDGSITSDELTREQLTQWVGGFDPESGARRGRDLSSPQADLLLDGTINAPKSFSLVALLHEDLAAEFEALQDRLRERVIRIWQRELNARRGAGGRFREGIHRLEVVELQHRRSRALDPHIHRHLWLSVKVQGRDGAWSNVDSRVAMKLHTLINAEGELAARTDPEWVSALARHGYTLNAAGEVAEVAHAVRPLSRRANQIEANRAVKLAGWRAAHPGQEPDWEVLRQIDRFAWSKDRPAKPRVVDEDDWAQLIRDEIAAIDPMLIEDARRAVGETVLAGLDRELLMMMALVDADQRSSASGGRFSMVDVRAGATRAVAASGIVATRDALQPLIDDVVAGALTEVVDLLGADPDRPQHVKAFMARHVAELKVELAARFDRLNVAGTDLTSDVVGMVADTVGTDALDEGQVDAARVIAGTNRLVTVTGPAGAGKTTMLRVAGEALRLQSRRMVVVAPTKKAASVAAREVGVTASSLHALLADYGWRWGYDDAGMEQWTRASVGDVEEMGVYAGPRRYPLRPGDRIVIDEAGMVDLHAARALAIVAEETGAQLAMVGDHLQALPVGHSGAMGCMARRSGAVVELQAIHRFRDPEYAALTLRLREPVSRADAVLVAQQLEARGEVHAVTHAGAARQMMVDRYFQATDTHQRIALVTATNDEADAINDAIQQRRLDRGELTLDSIAVGMDEQRILVGDTVQTRRNDTTFDVENRAIWTVAAIDATTLTLQNPTDPLDIRIVTPDYAADHLHLAYASTVHGVQGETTDLGVVGPGVGAAGLYVGMTRGRHHNEAIVLVPPHQTPIEVLADVMMRGTPEITLDDSQRAACTELERAARDPVESELAHLDIWIRDATAALAAADARTASADALSDARTADSATPDAADREALRVLLSTRHEAGEVLRARLRTPAPIASEPPPPAVSVAPTPSRNRGLSR
ncbi:AAA family ATPase [Microbacterium sp.]|uniref:AAA family ATPase n=1 Tax=Microbacterium sp. TaxID=51671 RepID=UPI003C7847F7